MIATPASVSTVDRSQRDGSALGAAYSEKKRRESPQVPINSSILNAAGGDVVPLDVVRTVMLELNLLGQNFTNGPAQDKLPYLTTMLQGLEEVLEVESSSGVKGARVGLSPKARFNLQPLFSPSKEEK